MTLGALVTVRPSALGLALALAAPLPNLHLWDGWVLARYAVLLAGAAAAGAAHPAWRAAGSAPAILIAWS
jgi:hypothetical protein